MIVQPRAGAELLPRHTKHGLDGLAKRFMSKLEITEDCWVWRGLINPTGYGIFDTDGPYKLAHRASYLLFVDAIANGLEIDHVCHGRDVTCAGGKNCLHRRCVKPAHLEAVAPRENTLRGRTPAAANAAKTHCPQGHPYDEANTYRAPSWGARRGCRACMKARELQRSPRDRRRKESGQ